MVIYLPYLFCFWQISGTASISKKLIFPNQSTCSATHASACDSPITSRHRSANYFIGSTPESDVTVPLPARYVVDQARSIHMLLSVFNLPHSTRCMSFLGIVNIGVHDRGGVNSPTVFSTEFFFPFFDFDLINACFLAIVSPAFIANSFLAVLERSFRRWLDALWTWFCWLYFIIRDFFNKRPISLLSSLESGFLISVRPVCRHCSNQVRGLTLDLGG